LFVGLTCLILFANVVTAVSNWGTIEIQEAITSVFGGKEEFGRTGISMTEALLWGRRALLVAMVVLIAGIVFAVFAVRGHRPSRVYLTVMCGLVSLFLVAVGGLVGVFAAAFAIFCAVQLWSRDARRWFDIKNGITPAPSTPRPVVGVTTATTPAYAPQDGLAAPPVASPARPTSVQVAGLVTIIASAIVMAVGSLILVQYVTARDAMLRGQETSPVRDWVALTDDELAEGLRTIVILSGVAVPLSLVAIGAASLLLMGIRLGRSATLALAILTVPVAFVSLIGLPWAVAAIVVIIALRKPEARAWFDRDDSR